MTARYEINSETTLRDVGDVPGKTRIVPAPLVECPICHERHHVIEDRDIPTTYLTHRMSASNSNETCGTGPLNRTRTFVDALRNR